MPHTPGPWKQHESEGKRYASVRGANNRCVADCGSRSDTIAQANAKLISAAPDMLNLLRKIAADNCQPNTGSRHQYANGRCSFAGVSLSVKDVVALLDVVEKATGERPLVPNELKTGEPDYQHVTDSYL